MKYSFLLQAVFSSGAIFTAVSDSEDTDTAEECVDDENGTFIDEVKGFIKTVPEEPDFQILKTAFQTMYKIEKEKLLKVLQETRDNRIVWKRERCGRLTASNFGRICRGKTSFDSILLDVMGYKDEVYSQAITWGNDREKAALDRLSEAISPSHVNLSIQRVGLFVDEDEPYLGATPDGLVTCDCCEDHLVEIKCPFAYRNWDIDSIPKHKFFLDHQKTLRENHVYFDQVQGQMAIAKVTKSYFVTMTETDFHFQLISFDEMRWETMKMTLKDFFMIVCSPKHAVGPCTRT